MVMLDVINRFKDGVSAADLSVVLLVCQRPTNSRGSARLTVRGGAVRSTVDELVRLQGEVLVVDQEVNRHGDPATSTGLS